MEFFSIWLIFNASSSIVIFTSFFNIIKINEDIIHHKAFESHRSVISLSLISLFEGSFKYARKWKCINNNSAPREAARPPAFGGRAGGGVSAPFALTSAVIILKFWQLSQLFVLNSLVNSTQFQFTRQFNLQVQSDPKPIQTNNSMKLNLTE